MKHAQLEGVTAAVVCMLSTEKNVTPVKEERAFVHHNKGSCKVICTSHWNKIKMEDKKRPADCGVVLSPKKWKITNQSLILASSKTLRISKRI